MGIGRYPQFAMFAYAILLAPASAPAAANKDMMDVQRDVASVGDKLKELRNSTGFCEFSREALCRQFGLPSPIDVNSVSASLDKGVLNVVAMKATQSSVK